MSPSFELPPDSLAAQFARRLAERDNPSPVVYSQEPAAVAARVEAWLHATQPGGNGRGRHRLVRLLLALVAHPERSTGQLAEAMAVNIGQAARYCARLRGWGLLASTDRGLYTYHRLLPATEDALLLVVAGPDAAARLRPSGVGEAA